MITQSYGLPVNIINGLILITWLFGISNCWRNLKNPDIGNMHWRINLIMLPVMLAFLISDFDAAYRGYISYFVMHTSCTTRDLALATWNDRGLKLLFNPLLIGICNIHRFKWLDTFR